LLVDIAQAHTNVAAAVIDTYEVDFALDLVGVASLSFGQGTGSALFDARPGFVIAQQGAPFARWATSRRAGVALGPTILLARTIAHTNRCLHTLRRINTLLAWLLFHKRTLALHTLHMRWTIRRL
jgi:hypothetical protein